MQPVTDKTALRQAPLAGHEDTNCDDHEHDPRFPLDKQKPIRKTGEQNPWISQTLRFTHIHNEKQPTDIVPGLNPIDNAEL